MTRGLALALVVGCAWSASVHAQTAAVQVTQSFGLSTESVKAAAVQVRGLAEPTPGLRFDVEAAWGRRSLDGTDVFGTAYPYGDKAELIEAYGEWYRPTSHVRSVRAGRYRTPFGLSSGSDHAYLGFLRPPLIRYPRYWALSTGYLEHGVDVLVGASRLSLEVSLGRPGDVGTAIRLPGASATVRAEGNVRGLVVGASYLDSPTYSTTRRGRTKLWGVDGRWMHAGVQLRGEWIDGQPWDGPTTRGGYLDGIVHVRAMGPITALARAERLGYNFPTVRRLFTQRYSAGLRVRAWQGLSVSIGAAHQAGQLTQRRRNPLDVGLTWALRKDRAPAR